MSAEKLDIFDRGIDWKLDDSGGPNFRASIDGEAYTLSMNNFPEEPLFTLRWKSESIDLDDLPSNWTLPELE